MRIFIDCEWNGFGGELISMALVGEDDREFYEVLGTNITDEWVLKNVAPILHKAPVTYTRFQIELSAFLERYDHVEIIADWHEDISHFCQCLTSGPGRRISTPDLSFKIERINSKSELPHNALEDAKALRKLYLMLEG